MPHAPVRRPSPRTPQTAQAEVAKIRKDVLARVAEDAAGARGRGRLAGKVAIITGVGPGISIGAATARLFAREGAAHLYLLDALDKHLPALAQSLAKDYPATKVTHVIADAADPAAITALIDRVLAEAGRLDVFFSNAGIGSTRGRLTSGASRSISETEADEYMEVMRVNALSGFLAVKYGAPAIGKVSPDKCKHIPGGSIILTASVAGLRAGAGPVPYSASKAAAVSLAQTASLELVGTNVRVNALCPGLIETAMTQFAFDAARAHGVEERIGAAIPMRRPGASHEIALGALYLASDESSYVNGTAHVVDGGLIAPLITSAPPPAPAKM